MKLERIVVRKWLLGAVGHKLDCDILEYAMKYWEKDVLTKEDVAEINAKIDAQYVAEETVEHTEEA